MQSGQVTVLSPPFQHTFANRLDSPFVQIHQKDTAVERVRGVHAFERLAWLRQEDWKRPLSYATGSTVTYGLIPFFGSPEGRVFWLWSRWRAGCASVIQQCDRGFLPDCPVRAHFVVVPAPILQFFPSIFKAHEPMGVQAFRAEAPVEGFDERVVRWLSRP